MSKTFKATAIGWVLGRTMGFKGLAEIDPLCPLSWLPEDAGKKAQDHGRENA